MRCLFWISTWIYVHANWITQTSLLPVSNSAFAVGSFNGKIFLIGGSSNSKIDEYDIINDAFMELPTLNRDIFGYSQFWTQKSDRIYMIEPRFSSETDSSTFSVFNMNNQQTEFNWRNITLQRSVYQHGCLASTTNYLFVVGGKDPIWNYPLPTLQILSLLSYKWLNSAPSMNTARSIHACIVNDGRLWVFGGETATNERIEIVNITHNSWNYTASLSTIINGLRVVAWKDYIYLIGGYIYDGNYNYYLDTMYIMNIKTESITLSENRMPYENADAGVILIDDHIYVFGGENDVFTEIDTWICYKIPTLSPSSETLEPTYAPSLSPSNSTPITTSRTPIAIQTELPSVNPSSMPPSYVPSESPQRAPSKAPTMNPVTFISSFTSTKVKLTLSNTTDMQTTNSDTTIVLTTSLNPVVISPSNAFTTTSENNNITITDTVSTQTTKKVRKNKANPMQQNSDILAPIIVISVTGIICICVLILIYFKKDLWKLEVENEDDLVKIAGDQMHVQHNVVEPGAFDKDIDVVPNEPFTVEGVNEKGAIQNPQNIHKIMAKRNITQTNGDYECENDETPNKEAVSTHGDLCDV